MIGLDDPILRQVLELAYGIGFNDGLREAVARKREQEGKEGGAQRCLDLLKKHVAETSNAAG